ncbi:MAG: sigma-70 family RNA polymerase sigma factor [Solirubrobacteraceae bacterium]
MSQPERVALWRQYREHGDLRARDRLVLSLAPLVKSIVYRKAREIPPHREVDDFVSCGLEALVRSIERYDPARGASLEQFVWKRVHGAVVDELRVFDWAPRSLRRLEREIDRGVDRFTRNHGRRPTREELSAALAISEAELASWQEDIARTEIGSLNALVGGEDGDPSEWLDLLASTDPDCDPERTALHESAMSRFRAAFDHLSSREQHVAVLLYVHELTLREIGETLGVSESRVCQIHSQLKRGLREELAADSPMLLEVA